MTNWFSQTTTTTTTTNIIFILPPTLTLTVDSTNPNSSSVSGTLNIINNASSPTNQTTLGASDYMVEFTVQNVLLAFFLISLGLSTILGNTFVLLAIFVDFHLRSPTHYLMGSLALADLLLGTHLILLDSILAFFKGIQRIYKICTFKFLDILSVLKQRSVLFYVYFNQPIFLLL